MASITNPLEKIFNDKSNSTAKILGENEEKFRRTFEAIPDPAAVWELRPDGQIVIAQINKTAYELTGGELTNFLSFNLDKLFGNEPESNQIISRVLEAGETIRENIFRQSRVTGEKSWFLVDFAKASDNRILVIAKNITQLKHAEEELKILNKTLEEQNKRLQQRTFEIEILYELSQKLDLTLDSSELFRFMLPRLNQVLSHDVAACLFLTKEKGELVIRPNCPLNYAVKEKIKNQLITTFIILNPRVQNILIDNLDSSLDLEVCDMSQPLVTDLCSVFQVPLVKSGENEIVGFLYVGSEQEGAFTEDQVRFLYTVANQISLAIEHKNAEVTRRDLEKRHAKFIAMTSHELRTPLTVILAQTEFLERNLDKIDSETMQKSINAIKKSLNRLKRLTDGVNDLIKVEKDIFRMDFEVIGFCEFITHVKQNLELLLGDSFEFHGCQEIAPVLIKADTTRLQQVLDNLIDNAVKNTPKKGRMISLSTEILPNVVEIYISDNGAGISPDNLERIFKQFTSIPTKYAVTGTGIGLYISRKIIEAHGGTLIPRSEGLDRGATFVLELPRRNSL